MAILQGDIQILASQSLTDTDSGGGAASGTEIADGVSNNLFDDISQLDRTIGRVNLRKIFPAVRTTDTDGLFGTHVVVSDPPDDPNVSAVLLSTGDHYDQRPAAQSRIEAYLTQGPASGGLLFGNHVAGMQTLSILQRKSEPILSVGETVLLRKAEGTASQAEQFFRITAVSYRDRQFTIPGNVTGETFSRTEVNYATSDPLRYDFPGFQAADSYRDSEANFTGKSRCYTTIVADAARYYGAVALKTAAAISDSVIYADGIYTQLVPSAQIETAIPDARLNQQTAALVAAGGTLSQTVYTSFSPSQALFIGGGVLPGSLTVVRDGITLTDLGGVLYNGAAQAGTIDYENGILAVTAALWSGAGNFSISYTPASAPTVVTRSAGVAITAASQRRTFVVAIDPIPARKSLQVSYRSGGRWYVLQEDGSGAVRGGDSAFGAGSLNFDTGTLTLTLGAMPDVGTQVILAWSPVAAARVPSTADLELGSRLFAEANVGPFAPGTLSLTWSDGSARTATDNAGSLQGAALGTCSYSSGQVRFAPASLPAVGTLVNWSITELVPKQAATQVLGDNGTTFSWSVQGPVEPKSLQLAVATSIPQREASGLDSAERGLRQVFDDGAGGLFVIHATGSLAIGTVDYSTGLVVLSKQTAGFVSEQGYWARTDGLGLIGPSITYQGVLQRSVTLTVLANASSVTDTQPVWAWWDAYGGEAAWARYGQSGGSSRSGSFTFDQLVLASRSFSSYGSLYLSGFRLGTTRYTQAGSSVVSDVSPATGEGTPVGYLLPHRAVISTWPAGASSLPSELRLTEAPASVFQNRDAQVDGVVFRTAAAPVKSLAFSLQGVFADGMAFTAQANSSGQLVAPSVFGLFDYQSGVCEVRFGTQEAVPADPNHPADGLVNLSYLGLPGVTWVRTKPVQADTLRYNAVAYTYIPLDADVLGLDPVRLPADGRVPVFRSGTVAVVQHTATTSPSTVTNGQTVNVGRVRLARVRVIGNNGATIDNGYSADLDAGTVTFSNVTGYSQPVRVEHRVEDTALVSEAQIDGTLKLTRPVTHAYPVGSVVSSALVLGDMRAAVSKVFDQATWNDVWSDDLIGAAAAGTYDTINHPLSVTNLGSVTERWSLRFTGSTAFACYGEHLGLIAYGTTSSDFAPVNPATGQPYFTLPALGWGGGWSLGNALRINTEGAMRPVWVARVIKQGPATVLNDQFSLLVRGDIDTP